MEALYTVKEVAKILKTNVNFVYDIINDGSLKALKIGSLKIRETALAEYIESLDPVTTVIINE